MVVLVERTRRDDDVGSFGGEPLRDRRADTPARAGDDDIASVEPSHGVPLRPHSNDRAKCGWLSVGPAGGYRWRASASATSAAIASTTMATMNTLL